MIRIQSFEFNERAECPKFIRDSLIEILGNGQRWSHVLDAIVPSFTEFCQKTGTDSILDLCSGSGEPVSILIESLERQNMEVPSFTISDLFPKIHSMELIAKRHPDKIKIIYDPIDATNVPKNFNFKACTFINSFHHFPPSLASSILEDCIKKERAVFISECFPRNFRCFVPFFPFLALASFINPLITNNQKILKLVFTYMLPAIAVMGTWDAVVSVLRIYGREELMELIKPYRNEFKWEYREISFFGGGRAVIFFGIPS
ncbi:MAG: hypothetical protein HQK76_15970 [Desulfobacterales bacterium]|nr:hypothetical protein [Desulfobacterales bacterium]